MFPSMKVDEEEFVLRPMNCPHHMLIFKNKLHSYRDLPIRIGEFATDFRYEASGAVKGLERVRCMCQNDAHLFVTPEQIGEEFKKVVNLILDVYHDFGIKDYKIIDMNGNIITEGNLEKTEKVIDGKVNIYISQNINIK